jgi:hypothetical protein
MKTCKTILQIVRAIYKIALHFQRRRHERKFNTMIPGGVEHSAVAGPTLTQVVDIFSPVREEYKF